jgi:hypothetical protein
VSHSSSPTREQEGKPQDIAGFVKVADAMLDQGVV